MVGAKMHKNAQIFVLQFKIFKGAMSPSPMLGRVTAPLLKPHPLGTPALRASRASFGASMVPQCLLSVDATAGRVSTSPWGWGLNENGVFMEHRLTLF